MEFRDFESDTIKLKGADGKKREYDVIKAFEHEGASFVACQEMNDGEDDEGTEIVILRDNGNNNYEYINDEEEKAELYECLQSLINDDLFDEEYDEDDGDDDFEFDTLEDDEDYEEDDD